MAQEQFSYPCQDYVAPQLVVYPIEDRRSSSEGLCRMRTQQRQRLGVNANFEVAGEIWRILCILVSTTLSRGIPRKFTSFQYFLQKPQRQELSFVLKPNLSDYRIRSSPTKLVTRTPAAGRSFGPPPPPRWPEGSPAVAAAAGGPFGSAGTAPPSCTNHLKRGNFNGRVDDQANQRTAVAARPAHELLKMQ